MALFSMTRNFISYLRQQGFWKTVPKTVNLNQAAVRQQIRNVLAVGWRIERILRTLNH